MCLLKNISSKKDIFFNAMNDFMKSEERVAMKIGRNKLNGYITAKEKKIV